MLKNGEIDMTENTTEGSQALADSYANRRTALQYRARHLTTLPGARALVEAALAPDTAVVSAVRELHTGAVS